MPGASSSITIRGVSSISSSNQPLMIVDGLPIDNKTTNTRHAWRPMRRRRRSRSATAASTSPTARPTSTPKTSSRSRCSRDRKPSALYGIDAANGAIVITTKRGRAGIERFRLQQQLPHRAACARSRRSSTCTVRAARSASGSATARSCTSARRIPRARTFYDNIDDFFQTALTQKHNLSFSGGTPTAGSPTASRRRRRKQTGVIPNSGLNKINLTGSSQGAGHAVAERGSVDGVHLREQRSAVQGRRQPAHRSARLAGHEQRGELADAGRHARAHHGPRGVDAKSTTRTSASTRTRATTRRTASSSTSASRSRRSRGAT